MDNGNLYTISKSGQGVSTGLTATPTLTLLGTDFVDICTAGGTYSTNQGVSGLQSDGTVYWSSNQPVVSWGVFASLGKCRTPIFGGYGNRRNAYVVKDDGLIYTNNSTTTFTKLNYNGVTETDIVGLGSLPSAFGVDGDGWLLIPD